MLQTFLAIAGDQRVIAGLALLTFSFFCLGCYITIQERKSRKKDPNWLGDWPI